VHDSDGGIKKGTETQTRFGDAAGAVKHSADALAGMKKIE